MKPAIVILCVLCLWPARLAAQEPGEKAVSPEVQRLVAEGQTAALEAKLGPSPSADERHLLAQAYANRARRTTDGAGRAQAWQAAQAQYEEWLPELERAARLGGPLDAVRLAAGRVEYGTLLLSGPAASELGEFEITLGRHGDRVRLRTLLNAARTQFEQAETLLTPLMADLSQREEQLLAVGLYDVLVHANSDMRLNLGWTNYYLGVLEDKNAAARQSYLSAAERRFQELVNAGAAGPLRGHASMALGMAQRELGRYREAERNLAAALADAGESAAEAQARYELARCQLAAGKFDEARTTLRPLVEKDLKQLGPGDEPARYYLNLAHLWDANSYLLEAEVVRQAAGDSAARAAILRKAQRSRETGLGKMRALADLGGAWPALVQVYVASSVSLDTPVSELSPPELLYTAGLLSDTGQYRAALPRLEAAAGRSEIDDACMADVLFELGRCRYQLGDERGAAEAFARLAREHRSHPRAPQAAELAYTLWGKVAEHTKQPADYAELASVLQNLIASFADHPKREEAAWLLPLAMQYAGQYEAAATQFAKIPATSARWEEAQFRRAMCVRQGFDARRGTLGAETYRGEAQAVAQTLVRYADNAAERAPKALRPDDVRRWAGQARVAAGELLVSAGVEDFRAALGAVEAFDESSADGDLVGRVLAVRIRAYRGLNEFEQASQILKRYLQSADPARVGGTLAALAEGMQAEVERRLAAGQTDAARQLAKDSVATFDELEKWVRADPPRLRNLEFVQQGQARMYYLAGEYEPAEKAVTSLLETNPRSGNYRHLAALILTARLRADSPAADVERVQAAWGALLTDPAIRTRATERYWEARYNWLLLALRLGQAAEVVQAITQERVWYPDLGGPEWKKKLESLLAEAEKTTGPAASERH